MISCIKNINEKKIVKTIKDTNLIFGVWIKPEPSTFLVIIIKLNIPKIINQTTLLNHQVFNFIYCNYSLDFWLWYVFINWHIKIVLTIKAVVWKLKSFKIILSNAQQKKTIKFKIMIGTCIFKLENLVKIEVPIINNIKQSMINRDCGLEATINRLVINIIKDNIG